MKAMDMHIEEHEARQETAALLRNLAERYERGEKLGAILIAALLPEGHVAVSGVAPGVPTDELLIYVGIINAAVGGIVEASQELEDKSGEAMKLLRMVSGGQA